MLFVLSRIKSRLKLFASVSAIMFSAAIANAVTFSTNSVADAFVATGSGGSLSVSNFGAAGALAVASPALSLGEFQSALKFNLLGARNSFDAQFGIGQWTVQSVTLRLSSSPHNNPIFNPIAPGQFGVSLFQNNSWLEGMGTGGIPSSDGISFTSLQNTYINNLTDEALGTFSFPGGDSGLNSYSLTLAPSLLTHLFAGDQISLRLFATDDELSYLFTSRSSGNTTTRPTLIIDAIPEPSSVALGVLGLVVWRFTRRARS